MKVLAIGSGELMTSAFRIPSDIKAYPVHSSAIDAALSMLIPLRVSMP